MSTPGRSENDLDELVRLTDRMLAAKDWDGLVELAERCRHAHERGHQLWPITSRCEYLLALAAPAPTAASLLRPGAGHLALGPLSEVAASAHTWKDLAPHLHTGPIRDAVAQERAARGDLVDDDPGAGPPLALAGFEPAYPLATYTADEVIVAEPDPLPGDRFRPLARAVTAGVDARADTLGAEALAASVAHWAERSGGRVRAVEVHGDLDDAVGALGGPDARVLGIDAAAVLGRWAWAAASGGAHGPRRGVAAARFELWWALAVLGECTEPWPPEASELDELVDELDWALWLPVRAADTSGWQLRIAVADPVEGRSYALEAVDQSLSGS